MAPKKARVRRLPRNTVTWVIDGTVEVVLTNFRDCRRYFRYWNFCRGAFRVRVGNRVMYTTPLQGTFYYVLRYRNRSLVFVIVARQYWLIGFFGANGFYQMKFEGQTSLYMDSTKGTVMTPFGANHNEISPGGVENTSLDLHAIRESFDSVDAYRGPNHAQPEGFPAAIGRIAVLIMETKFTEIHERCDQAMVAHVHTTLGSELKMLVVNWSTLCKIVMNGIMKGGNTEEEIAKIRLLLGKVLIFQVDAVNRGLFAHRPLPPEPRTERWQPIDEEYSDGGEADNSVPNFDAPPPAAIPRHTARRGLKRGISAMSQIGGKRTRIGLRGGGAGGLPTVPHWFSSWKQKDEDKIQCDLLVAEARELGLSILEVSSLDASKSAEQKNGSGGEVPLTKNRVSNSDLHDLRNNEFLSDTLITNFFNALSSRLNTDDILLVDTTVAVAYAQDPASIPEMLRDRRIVVLPVNNSTEFGHPGRGTHWSVLVINNTSESSPRFIHHDTSDGLNRVAAQELASSMRRIFPAAQEVEHVASPRQQNGYDCAVYVMAIARLITRWWRNRASEEDWMGKMWTHVNDQNVRTLRREFAERLEKEHQLTDLRNNGFLSDTVISNFFNAISSRLGTDDVHLVDAAVAIAYAQDPATIPEMLRDRRIVVLPVNNSNDFEHPDRGTHWSVLVIDNTSESSPRFIHHDSSDGLNRDAAQNLAARMRTIFPAAQEVEHVASPRQQNGYDCAVYVMAIARSITRWWRNRASERDWIRTMWDDVTADNVRRLRRELAERLEKDMKKVEGKEEKAKD